MVDPEDQGADEIGPAIKRFLQEQWSWWHSCFPYFVLD